MMRLYLFFSDGCLGTHLVVSCEDFKCWMISYASEDVFCGS